MSTLPSIDVLLLNLIESIRTEMTSLNTDLHSLEVNLKSIELVDQKTEYLTEKINVIQNKIHILEKKLTELSYNTVSMDDFNERIDKMLLEIEVISKRCDSIEVNTIDIRRIELERKANKERMIQLVIGILIAMVGTLGTLWLGR